MEIVQAEQKDLPYIITHYKKGLEELGAENIKDSLILNKVVSGFHLAPCFLLKIDGIIRGIAGLTVVHSSHSGDAMLSEYMFYVEPEYRSLKHLSALVNACKDFADEHNFLLRFEFVNQVDIRIRERLFKMHNFQIKSVIGEYDGRR
jgi:GNAT superfamily N-acetyltransferase